MITKNEQANTMQEPKSNSGLIPRRKAYEFRVITEYSDYTDETLEAGLNELGLEGFRVVGCVTCVIDGDECITWTLEREVNSSEP